MPIAMPVSPSLLRVHTAPPSPAPADAGASGSSWGPAPLASDLSPAVTTLSPEEARNLHSSRSLDTRPWSSAAEDGRAEVQAKVRSWATHHERALKAGVDLTRATFMSKLVALGSALVSLGIASALAIATGGVATPLLIVATVRATVLVADCACAFVDWKRSQESPPRSLPLGANSLGNLVYSLAKSCLSEPDEAEKERQAKRWGQGVSAVAVIGLAAAGMTMTMPTEGFTLATLLTGSIASGTGLVGGAARAGMAARAEHRVDIDNQAKQALFELLRNSAQRFFVAPDGTMDRSLFDTWCAQITVGRPEATDAPDAALSEAFETLRDGAWASAPDYGRGREARDQARMDLDTSKRLTPAQRTLALAQVAGYAGALDLALIQEIF